MRPTVGGFTKRMNFVVSPDTPVFNDVQEKEHSDMFLQSFHAYMFEEACEYKVVKFLDGHALSCYNEVVKAAADFAESPEAQRLAGRFGLVDDDLAL